MYVGNERLMHTNGYEGIRGHQTSTVVFASCDRPRQNCVRLCGKLSRGRGDLALRLAWNPCTPCNNPPSYL